MVLPFVITDGPSYYHKESIIGREVSSELSLSGHRHMQFNFEDCLPETIRELVGTPFERISRGDWNRAHK